jgi:uncharacterized protein YndB with AHSA1/START domain
MERLFDAWLKPFMISKWMFTDMAVQGIAINPVVGGEFSFTFSRQSDTLTYFGSYHKIEKPNHLQFSWHINGDTAESIVTVNFQPVGNGAALILTHRLCGDERLARNIESDWRYKLDCLGNLLAST